LIDSSLCYNKTLIFNNGLIMTSRWLSVEEIAAYLGVSKDTVYAWREKKGLPAHRVGRFWKFKTDEVDEWVKSGSAAESSEGE
jgi:excisionase family DNA binding protein